MTPATAHAQQLRLSRINMSTAVYAVCWVLLVFFRHQGVVQLSALQLSLLGIALVVVAVGFRFLVSRNWNLTFRDPSLTIPQLMIASLWSFVPIYYNPALRGELLMVHVTMYFFACFRLKRQQFLAVSCVPISLYLVVIAADQRFHPGVDIEREIFRFSLFVVTLIIVSIIGGYTYDVRRALKLKQQALIKANEIISRQASYDALTGLFNRRYLMDAMTREEARAKRRGGRFSVIICDIDHFKSINDRFGHLVGDQVLQVCAQTITLQLRQEDSIGHAHQGNADDVLARYGGEEFVVLLPDTDDEGATLCAERLRAALAALNWSHMANDIHVTASFGLATFRPGDGCKDVLARADSALYEAKHAGRDRVVVAH